MTDKSICITHLILEVCDKNIDFGTGERYDPSNPDHYSEWAMAMALQRYKEGELVLWEEFEKTLNDYKFHQQMIRCVDNGELDLVVDENGDIGYRLTEKGKKKVKKK